MHKTKVIDNQDVALIKYKEYKQLDLPGIGRDILSFWEENKIFEKSIRSREGKTPYIFYEGPPSANGLPGIHHVMSRTIKDIFCRYHTLKGKQVKRKAGWDTHGLPIELAVEKTLGITKEDIGKKITIEEYNQACRREVMKYTDKWEEVTRKIGYWVDMEHPYVTYHNTYIESAWWLLKDLYKKQLLYKGYTIQPYSPAAGTGLSSHELNQPGCYRNVKDTSIVAMFKIKRDEKSAFLFKTTLYDVFFLAWTTTPWTLPANCALAVGENIEYVKIETVNIYSKEPITIILAKDLISKYFQNATDFESIIADELATLDESKWEAEVATFQKGQRKYAPYRILPFEESVKDLKDYTKLGSELVGIHYEQLLPYVQPEQGDAFRVILGDFVTTEDGTGIVHTASVFGADDFRVCKLNNVPSVLVKDENGTWGPLVDRQGRFVKEVNDAVFPLGGKYIKEEYLSEAAKEQELKEQQEKLKPIIPKLDKYLSVDELLGLKLKLENRAFRIEKYEHSYPHCWRTDKPVLYYPLDSWFIKASARKERMAELNRTINWKPESTGTGRFGEWLNNLQDWNLSRSRFWGIPLPVWRTEDSKEETCIGSVQELYEEIEKSVKAGWMKKNPILKKDTGFDYDSFDLHRPNADEIILVSPSGKKMYREPDLIDVWFDSGAMPYAQFHYPFENRELIDQKKVFPADFIAEGVDQTRGWFYTLHAIAVMCFDSVAYKNVVSNGLVLDKNGNKMSKRLGNAVDPFTTIEKYGPDAVRWYMVTNASPWENLKFDMEGVAEVQRSFFGTLYNTYAFFALYANIDGFSYQEKDIPAHQRPEIDRWILSELNSLIKTVDEAYADYEPTKAGRAIEYFLDENLSNWYVRLCRRRFWKGEYTQDKIAAYQTLYTCLEVIARLSSPLAPFFMERLFTDLNSVTRYHPVESVHLSDFPVYDHKLADTFLEEKMKLAQKISSMILSIRKKENIRVRQPLMKIRIPVLDDSFRKKLEAVKELILSEVNVKQIEYVDEKTAAIVKDLKLNFKTLGKKYGKQMKFIQTYAEKYKQEIISSVEKTGKYTITTAPDKSVESEDLVLSAEDVEIIPVDIPGWKVVNEGPVTVALDVTLTPELIEEGIARELVNRIQNLRKEKGFGVTDRIQLKIQENNAIKSSVNNNLQYICSETLANSLEFVSELKPENAFLVEVDEKLKTFISIDKFN